MDILKQLNFSEIRFVGYAFQIEMKYWAWCSGFDLLEIPIVFTNREKESPRCMEISFGKPFMGFYICVC